MDERRPILKLPVLGCDGEGDGFSRRRFLALLGASAALATGASCKRNRAAIVAYTKKQEEIVPGVADYYASTFQEGEVAYPVLVKAREGRPIHVEGNPEHPRYRGRTSFHATADLLGLYDPDRLRAPLIDGRPGTWKAAVEQLARALKDASSQHKGIVLVTPAVLSPTRKALLARLAEALPSLRHIAWEPAADHQERQAQRELFGETRLPQYRFDKAQIIVALEADFLGTLGDTVSAIAGFASMRRPASSTGVMNRMYAIEGGMSLTGSRADVRIPMRPSALSRIGFGLVRALHLQGGRALPEGLASFALEPFAADRLPEVKSFAAEFKNLVKDLCAAGDRSLVLAGPAASADAHAACLILNHMLSAESDRAPSAPDLSTPDEFKQLIDQMAAGQFGVAVFWDVNPAYDLADGDSDASAWRAAMAKVPLRVRMGLWQDETAATCNLVLPTNHWLESWNDFETSGDALTLQQPVVAPLYDTLQGEEVFLRCLTEMGRPARENIPRSCQATLARTKSRPRTARSLSRVSGTPVCTMACTNGGQRRSPLASSTARPAPGPRPAPPRRRRLASNWFSILTHDFTTVAMPITDGCKKCLIRSGEPRGEIRFRCRRLMPIDCTYKTATW